MGRGFESLLVHKDLLLWKQVFFCLLTEEKDNGKMILDMQCADMAELADASDLGSDGATCAGSSPVIRRKRSGRLPLGRVRVFLFCGKERASFAGEFFFYF